MIKLFRRTNLIPKIWTTPPDNIINPDILNLINWKQFHKNNLGVNLGLKDDQPIYLDIQTAPHILIGGATGSGKSVCINLMIYELLTKNNPNRLELWIADPKRVDYSIYKGLPHLRRYETEPETIAEMLGELVKVMGERYRALDNQGVRKNIELSKPFPAIVLVFDELASIKNKQAINYMNELARLGRACDIHLIIATQRPDRTVIDGQLKANCPTVLAFRLKSVTDSRVLLDRKGAELLKGMGDGLKFDSFGNFEHFQGAFVSDEDIQKVVNWWIEQDS